MKTAKENVPVHRENHEKIKTLMMMNYANPENYSKLFTCQDDAVGELLRVYEEAKGPIVSPAIAKGSGTTRITILGAEGI